MKLLSALFTTFIIVAIVWGIALLQMSSTSEEKDLTENSQKHETQMNVKTGSPATSRATIQDSAIAANQLSTNIAGVNAYISIANIDRVWQSFKDKTLLHARLIKQPNKVYVYYRNFSNDFQSAEVTIGYNADIIKPLSQPTAQVKGSYSMLLGKGAHTEAKLAEAWTKIDYRKQLHSVVEIHYLDKNSLPTSTEMLVKYH